MLVFRHNVRPLEDPPLRLRYLSALLFLLMTGAAGQAAGGGGGGGGGGGDYGYGGYGGGGYYRSGDGEGGECTPGVAIFVICFLIGIVVFVGIMVCIAVRCTDADDSQPVAVDYLKTLAHGWVQRWLPAEACADYKLLYEYDFCARPAPASRAPIYYAVEPDAAEPEPEELRSSEARSRLLRHYERAYGLYDARAAYPSGVWRGHYEQNGRKNTVPDFGLDFNEFSAVICVHSDEDAERSRQESPLPNGSGGDDIGSYDIVGLYCSAIVERDTAPLASPRVAFVKTYRRSGPLWWGGGNLAHSILYQAEVVAGWVQVRIFFPFCIKQRWLRDGCRWDFFFHSVSSRGGCGMDAGEEILERKRIFNHTVVHSSSIVYIRRGFVWELPRARATYPVALARGSSQCFCYRAMTPLDH